MFIMNRFIHLFKFKKKIKKVVKKFNEKMEY